MAEMRSKEMKKRVGWGRGVQTYTMAHVSFNICVHDP